MRTWWGGGQGGKRTQSVPWALRMRVHGADSIAEDCGKLSGIREALGIMGCGCLGIASNDVLILE